MAKIAKIDVTGAEYAEKLEMGLEDVELPPEAAEDLQERLGKLRGEFADHALNLSDLPAEIETYEDDANAQGPWANAA